jgi:hypothetical protein
MDSADANFCNFRDGEREREKERREKERERERQRERQRDRQREQYVTERSNIRKSITIAHPAVGWRGQAGGPSSDG